MMIYLHTHTHTHIRTKKQTHSLTEWYDKNINKAYFSTAHDLIVENEYRDFSAMAVSTLKISMWNLGLSPVWNRL